MRVLRNQVPRHATQRAAEFIRTQIEREPIIWPSYRDDGPNWNPAITQLLAYLPPLSQGLLCEPQMIVFPAYSGEIGGPLHIDEMPTPPLEGEMPPWAAAKAYEQIVSVALTDQLPENGGVVYGEEREAPELKEGDVVLIAPDEPHGPTRNETEEARIVVYFRYSKED